MTGPRNGRRPARTGPTRPVRPAAEPLIRPAGSPGRARTPPRTLGRVRTQRGLVDYALQRRALLAEVRSGRAGIDDVCDASPYLLRAAKFHGVPTDVGCPMCRKEPLTHVYWVYGDEIKHLAGSARVPDELRSRASPSGRSRVYKEGVGRPCSWNHRLASS